VSASAYRSLDVLQRMVNAVERVRQRLALASGALGAAKVPYAVIGGNAVAAWVATVDEAAVRNTQDVDILIRRADFPAAQAALEKAGFVYRRAAGLDLFLDNASAGPRHAVHLVFAGEMVRPGEPAANPDVAESTELGGAAGAGRFRVINLEALVRIKLTAFRDKDRTHLRDLLAVGLIDASWTKHLPQALAARLQQIIDTPDG
jgi:hypothetical protein